MTLFFAFLRFFLDEFFGEQDQAEDLCPFGDDVADDLAPLGFGIDVSVESDPSDAGNEEKNRKGMIHQGRPDGAKEFVGRLSTFGGAEFVKIFGGKYGDDDSGPIGDGIAEERAEMFAGICKSVEADPKDQNGDRSDTEGMFAEERFL